MKMQTLNIKTTVILLTILFSSCISTRNKTLTNSQKDNTNINSNTTLQTGWYFIVDKNNGVKRQLDKDTIFYYLDPKPIITAKNIEKSEIYLSRFGDTGLSMKLDKKGTKAWSNATERTIGNQLAFIVDNKLLSVPKVNAQITGGMAALNRNIYTREQLEEIMLTIENEKK